VEKTIVTPELQAYFDEKQKQLMQKESLAV